MLTIIFTIDFLLIAIILAEVALCIVGALIAFSYSSDLITNDRLVLNGLVWILENLDALDRLGRRVMSWLPFA